MPQSEPLSPYASELMARLSEGTAYAIPSVYPGSLSGMEHASIFFSNAAALAKGHGRPDSEVFGVLYGIRHGLELFLKCMCQNRLVDDFLEKAAEGSSLEEVFEWLEESNPKHWKAQRTQLLTVLSVVRNVQIDGINMPACWTENQGTVQDPKFARAGLKYVQENGHLDRYIVSNLWVPSFNTHNLLCLFRRAAADLNGMHESAAVQAERDGVSPPAPVETVVALCELYERWDPDGHAIRYSTSSGSKTSATIHGWNIHLPAFNLDVLGEVAAELKNTVDAYDNLLGFCYSFATLRSPHPSYESCLYI